MTRSKTLLLPTMLTTLTMAAAMLLGGCKSGPAKVCAKIDELAAKALTEGDEGGKKLASNTMAESPTCVSRMKTLEQKDPEEFAQLSTCIEGATELKQVLKCMFEAAGGNELPTKIQIPKPAAPE